MASSFNSADIFLYSRITGAYAYYFRSFFVCLLFPVIFPLIISIQSKSCIVQSWESLTIIVCLLQRYIRNDIGMYLAIIQRKKLFAVIIIIIFFYVLLLNLVIYIDFDRLESGRSTRPPYCRPRRRESWIRRRTRTKRRSATWRSCSGDPTPGSPTSRLISSSSSPAQWAPLPGP